MPILVSKVTYTATGKFPVVPANLSCKAELWLSKDGISKDATSGQKLFTSTGEIQSVSFPVTMPSGGFNYRVFLDIYTDSILIAAFEGTEKATVPGVGTPTITW